MRVLVLVAAMLSIAHADAQVGVVVVGEPTRQKAVKAVLESWLSQHGYSIVAAPLEADAQKTLLNCFVIEDMACARGTFEKRSKAESIVFARIELGGNRELALTGYWLARDHDAVAEKRWCRKCDDPELARTLDELMMFLTRASGLGGGHLEIHSKPDGMAVVLDDQPIGNAPIERNITPGTHVIKLVRGDQIVATKTVTVDAGATASVTLRAGADARDQSRPASRQLRLLPLVLLGAGGVAIIGGGIYLYYGQKGGPDERYIYPFATRDGVVLTIAGAVSVIAGGVLWWRSARGAPAVAVSRAGATIGWAGQF